MNSAYSDGTFYAINHRYNPFIEESVRDLPCGKVADFGCGTGSNLYHLMKAGWDVYGIDQELVAVEKARTLLPPAQVFLSDLDGFDFSVFPQVDLVLCNYVFQHLSYAEIERFMIKISAKINPCGHFILSFFEHRGEVDFAQVSSCFVEQGWTLLQTHSWCREDRDHGQPHIHEGIESFWCKSKM